MDKISPELAKLMADRFRELAQVDPEYAGDYFVKNWVGVAARIVEKLPKPVDPDLVEAIDNAIAYAKQELAGGVHPFR